MRKVILDLCGNTGAWGKPYADAGYEVATITLPTHNVRQVEMNQYSLLFRKQNLHYYDDTCILLEDIHGILAAPPCTEFSLAKGSKPRDLTSAMETVLACLQIIWHCRIHGNPQFWALENPKGLLRQFLGCPAYTFEQWEFGDNGIKPTDLWGYFKPPVKTVKNRPSHLSIKYKGQHSHGRLMAVPKCPEEYKHLNLSRAAIRAITPPGFARAFFKANP